MASSGPGHGQWRGGSSRRLWRQPHQAVASSGGSGAVAHRAVGLWWGGSGSSWWLIGFLLTV